jgi:subtilisin family serine protease
MSRPIILKGKFFRILLFCLLAFSMSYFVLSFITEGGLDKGRRLRPGVGNTSGAEYREGEVLVRFKPRVSHHDVEAIADSALSAVAKRYKALSKIDRREYALLKSKHRTTQQMIAALLKNPQVEAVSPNFLLHVDSNIPNDEYFDYLWGLHNTGQTGGPSDIDINAPEAWDITTGSSSIIIGVIDTGIDYNHPDLIPNIWVNPGEISDGIDNDGNGYIDDIHGINAISSSGDPLDDHSHGTHCSGIIGAAGNNSQGVVGVNWNVKLIGTKFLDATGYGTDADALECINYMIDLKTTYGQNIVAVNASFGGGDYDPVMESAIDTMGTAGIIFCAAAGNDWMDNDATPHYPSSYTCSNLIAVTAVDYMGWQNFNYGATSVDLGAPGVEILSTISAVYYPQVGDIFFDDMESGSGNWVTGGTNNSWGITTDQEMFEEPLYPVPSPPHFWSDSPGTDYLPDTDSWLMNASDIDLSGYAGQELFLGFGSAMFFEALIDHAYVEVSGDGGSTWHNLMDFTEYAIFWYIPFNILIPDFVKTPHFRFRFHLVTDYSIEWAGWLIDEVGIGTASYYSYSFKSGTSMAAPHVTGAVALVASLYPTDSVSQRVARILNNVTPLPSLVDTCVTEGMLNLKQAIILPGTPWDPSPSDGAVDVPINTLLDWNDCGGAESYDVYFGTSTSPSFAGNITTSSYDPGDLDYDTTYYWKVVAKNASGDTSGPEWNFSTESAGAAEKNDFNGDGQDDILWRNYSTGQDAVWFMEYTNGAMTGLDLENFGMLDVAQSNRAKDLADAKIYRNPMEAGSLLSKNAAKIYRSPMEAAGFINQIEPAEFSWEELSDEREIQVLVEPGDVGAGVVRIQGLAIGGTANLCTVTDTSWQIVGTGDFNGDEKVDILWRNYANGKNSVWYMNGVAVIGGANLCSVTDTSWQIVGTGDFNGDEKVDILWRNYADGKNSVWYMDGVAVIGGTNLCSVTDTNWKIENH